ncbi:MAG: hypothetical protein IJV39_06520 [Ruminococcus sp.]|nr:hypothetical protein [Ruminococcus sp.]
MNFENAVNSLGGITFGIILLLAALVILAVARTIQIRKGNKSRCKPAIKAVKLLSIAGVAVGIISVIYMIATGSVGSVQTLLSTMHNSESAIYNNNMYVKTEFTYNGTNDYELEKVSNAYSGEGNICKVNDFKKFDILTAMQSNITGTVFVREDEADSFTEYYTDYRNNFDINSTFDTQNDGTKDVSKYADAELFAILADEANYSNISADSVPYSDKFAETECCIFSATSKDKIITEQIRIYPKNDNGKYIKALADSDEIKYYELSDKFTKSIDRIFAAAVPKNSN